MASYTKVKLSGSTNGRGIKVAATSTAGTTIHTTGTANIDEVWLYAYNSDTVARTLTIEWGGTSAPDDNQKINIPSLSGLTLVVPGLCLYPSGSGLTVAAFASVTNVIVITGFVNRIS
jgi:hypothetical protein